MIKNVEIQMQPQFADSRNDLVEACARALRIAQSDITDIVLERRSLDARSKRPFYRCRLRVFVGESPLLTKQPLQLRQVSNASRVIILGGGPAGLFAALRLISLGFKPVLLERGKAVRDRRRDLALISREGEVNSDSNYCFGEGGAGTYSDGKLYSRSGKKEDLDLILRLLVLYGAPHSILADARAHIGTNKLPAIITAISEAIEEHGGEIHFSTRVEDILINEGKFKALVDQRGDSWDGAAVIIAGGHSSRDLFRLLNKKSIQIEPKGFALGVRIEHDQQIINVIQYHSASPDPFLPPANYQLVEQIGSRGVFSFCMCPGGIIAPCATADAEIVVNGWSPSRRNNPWANSGFVVQIDPRDVPASSSNPLALLNLQASVEKAAYVAGGGRLVAPGQRMVDFVERKTSLDLPRCSYYPGVSSASLDEVLPELVSDNLRRALPEFGKKMRGFFTNDAILVGVESRTSSPVRIPRDKISLEHPQVSGLFPCGEGAGYAGGIMSAAIDGLHVAEAIAYKLLS